MIRKTADIVADFACKLDKFEQEARRILSSDDNSQQRVITLTKARNSLVGLSLSQGQLFDQALRCIESRIYKAAHVMAWAAFMDYIEKLIDNNGLDKLHQLRPKWRGHSTFVELRENVNEYQLLDAARDLRLLRKQETKILKGCLAKRNECAHPSDYFPGMNEALGYVDELLRRITNIQKRNIK